MGRYVPPDQEGVVSANKASGKCHPLGARASKLKSSGVLTVRFECPFAIWCSNCNPSADPKRAVIIGQGVRFNAEKQKVGNYYSTPIWSFRFKHTVCGGWIEVRTDPKNAEYVVTEGGKRRDVGEGKGLVDGEVRIGATEEEKERLEKEGGFGALEKKVEDKRRALSEKGRLEELMRRSEMDWEDPFERNKRLRAEFRVGRKERKVAEDQGVALQEKLGFGYDLAEEKDEDSMRAKLIEFGEQKRTPSRQKPLFPAVGPMSESNPVKDMGKRGKKSNAAEVAAENRLKLGKQLSGNTRAAMDPFLAERELWQPPVKRTKVVAEEEKQKNSESPLPSVALVGYDSD